MLADGRRDQYGRMGGADEYDARVDGDAWCKFYVSAVAMGTAASTSTAATNSRVYPRFTVDTLTARKRGNAPAPQSSKSSDDVHAPVAQPLAHHQVYVPHRRLDTQTASCLISSISSHLASSILRTPRIGGSWIIKLPQISIAMTWLLAPLKVHFETQNYCQRV